MVIVIGLLEINIGEKLQSIGDSAFNNCKVMSEFRIPKSIQYIGNNVFTNCKGLTAIDFTGTIIEWNSIAKGLYWNNGSSITTIHCSDGDITL